jgi:hypothetical protein
VEPAPTRAQDNVIERTVVHCWPFGRSHDALWRVHRFVACKTDSALRIICRHLSSRTRRRNFETSKRRICAPRQPDSAPRLYKTRWTDRLHCPVDVFFDAPAAAAARASLTVLSRRGSYLLQVKTYESTFVSTFVRKYITTKVLSYLRRYINSLEVCLCGNRYCTRTRTVSLW